MTTITNIYTTSKVTATTVHPVGIGITIKCKVNVTSVARNIDTELRLWSSHNLDDVSF